MEKERGFNGWTNYETWACALWLGNEPGTYELQREWAKQAKGVGQLADMIRDFVEEENPLSDKASMYSDLLNGALSEVNWHEIAESIKEDNQ